jgi:CheY-like chemotaxis protein
MSAKALINRPPAVVLIAEDDPNDVLLMKRAFAKAAIPATLFFVSNGQEAISYLEGQKPFDNRTYFPFPNILLVDVNMPGVGGLEVLEWLAARPERATLVAAVFSSCIAPEHRRQAASLGAHLCLTKPFDPCALLPILYKSRPGAGLNMFS